MSTSTPTAGPETNAAPNPTTRTGVTSIESGTITVALYAETRTRLGRTFTVTSTSTVSSSTTQSAAGPAESNPESGKSTQSPTTTIASNPTPTPSSSAPGAASPTTSTATPSPSGGSGKYTVGSLAGGIVGAALGAAIITFLITFLLCRRRNRTRSASSQRYENSNPRWTPVKGGMAVAEKPASGSDNYGLGWQAYLPDSADDRTIQNAVKTLFDQVELHVDNYYSKVDVAINDSVRADLALLDSKKLPVPLAQMMENPQVALAAIKHCIASLLIGKFTPGDNAARSLLPARFATVPSRLESSSMPAGEYHATQQAYSQWKRLNSFLFPLNKQDATDQRRLQSVSTELAESIYLAFLPWQSQRQNEEELKQHERSLMTKASDVGQLILSQPSAYEFEWTGSSRGAQFDVFPGFVKMSDEQGRPLESPQSLLPPTTSRL